MLLNYYNTITKSNTKDDRTYGNEPNYGNPKTTT
jgi:hypothetical protein